MISALIPVLGPIFGKVITNLFPDPEQQAKAQQEMTLALLAHQKEIETAAASIINTEAASKHWLAANWRPLTMITFVSLIVARWFGWTAENMTEAEYLEIYDLIKLGLGGYVVGRSVEKIAPSVISTMRRNQNGNN